MKSSEVIWSVSYPTSIVPRYSALGVLAQEKEA